MSCSHSNISPNKFVAPMATGIGIALSSALSIVQNAHISAANNRNIAAWQQSAVNLAQTVRSLGAVLRRARDVIQAQNAEIAHLRQALATEKAHVAALSEALGT